MNEKSETLLLSTLFPSEGERTLAATLPTRSGKNPLRMRFERSMPLESFHFVVFPKITVSSGKVHVDWTKLYCEVQDKSGEGVASTETHSETGDQAVIGAVRLLIEKCLWPVKVAA